MHKEEKTLNLRPNDQDKYIEHEISRRYGMQYIGVYFVHFLLVYIRSVQVDRGEMKCGRYVTGEYLCSELSNRN